MVATRKLGGLIGTVAILGAAFAPAPLSAQLDAQRSSGMDVYSLMQVSIDTSKVPLEQFRAETEAARGCGDLRKLAKELDGDIRRNRWVMDNELPQVLKATLKELPTGEASQVFSDDGKTVRVLMICSRV